GKVSIHAPRVGRDVALTVYRPEAFVFQSTRPGWGATAIMDNTGATSYVSIHAPRVGRDRVYRKERIAIQSFNPRAPGGARRRSIIGLPCSGGFNPRAPGGARRPIPTRTTA